MTKAAAICVFWFVAATTIFASESKTAPIPRLTEIESLPREFREPTRMVVGAVSALGLNPGEYFVEIHANDSDHTIAFSLWHESAMAYFEMTRGDPTGKCRTAYYSVEQKRVIKIVRWQ